MKKALIVAYQFPPMGGSGVQRTTKFVKYLRNFGWEPVVFTREVKNMALKDETLLKDIPQDIKILRTSPWDFTEWPGILSLGGKLISRKVLIPDGERLWQIFSRNKAVQAIEHEKFDLIYTTSYPYSDHLMGMYLKERFPNIPWVADFRDEWTNNPYLLDNPHNRFRMNAEKAMERKVLRKADYLITNTPVMLANFLKDDPSLKDKFTVIPNGYDEEDFKHISSETPHNDKFTLTYTGLLYGRRKPDTFFEATRQLINEGKIDRNKVYIQLIGNFKASYMNELLERFELSGVVNVLPYMKHKECIQKLMQSDGLLLIEGKGPGAEAFYTGKVFEYMNTGRPIMAIIPGKGAAAQLIRDTHTGCVADFDDIAKIKENFLSLYSDWLSGKGAFSPQWDKIRRFERKALTQELSKVFEEAINRVKSR
ncbi:MAG: glycosyltransferase [Clostridia bacterium]|nr:glycosyltransferase [Clostridia bacterium]